MRDVVRIVLAIVIIWIAWKIIKGILGLVVGIVIAGLLIYGGMRLLGGPRS
jgi:hypothetical protein